MTSAPARSGDEGAHRNPVVAWTLLIAGYATLWISVTVRAVTVIQAMTSTYANAAGGTTSTREFVDHAPNGWTCVLFHPPTQPMNAVLALVPIAFVLWRLRAWSGWRALGIAACLGALFVQMFLLFTGLADDHTRIVAYHEGFWLWVAGPIVMCLAFVSAPPAARRDPDTLERVFARVPTRRDWATGAWLLGALGFVAAHLLPARDLGTHFTGWVLLARDDRAWLLDAAALFVSLGSWFAIRRSDAVWHRLCLALGGAVLVAQIVGPLAFDDPDARRLIIGWYVWWAATLTVLIALFVAAGVTSRRHSASA